MQLLLTVYVLLFTGNTSGNADAQQQSAGDQEAFSLAVAKAYARTHLSGLGAPPYHIAADISSFLAVRAMGEGVFEEDWEDAHRWRLEVHFKDFTLRQMRNDEGRYWVENAQSSTPLRVQEALDLAMIRLPSTSQIPSYLVGHATESIEEGVAVTCYAASQPTLIDQFARSYRWCFDSVTGLLHSEDYPLDTHVVFSDYVSFNGKQVYTHVSAKASGLPILTLKLTYSELSSHVLDGLLPSGEMKRRETPSDSVDRAIMHLERATRIVRAGLPDGAAPPDTQHPVVLRFLIGADGLPVDAVLAKSPTEVLAKAALQAGPDFRFEPMPPERAPTREFLAVSFGSSPTAVIADVQAIALLQLRHIFDAMGMSALDDHMLREVVAQEQAQLPTWWPASVTNEIIKQAAQIDRAPILLPFYQQCFSSQDGRLLEHALETPEGRVWGHHMLGFVFKKELEGMSAPDAVARLNTKNPELEAQIAGQLDAQDRAHLHAFSDPRYQTAIATCMRDESPQAMAAMQKAESPVIDAVVRVHQSEIDAAKEKYAAAKQEQSRP